MFRDALGYNGQTFTVLFMIPDYNITVAEDADGSSKHNKSEKTLYVNDKTMTVKNSKLKNDKAN